MAITVRIPEELDARLEALAKSQHVSKHSLLLQGAELMVQRASRAAEVEAAIDFVLDHDAELMKRLADA